MASPRDWSCAGAAEGTEQRTINTLSETANLSMGAPRRGLSKTLIPPRGATIPQIISATKLISLRRRIRRAAGAGHSASAFEAPSVIDIGLSHRHIIEARQIRDAEEADPGIIRHTLNTLIELDEAH